MKENMELTRDDIAIDSDMENKDAMQKDLTNCIAYIFVHCITC